MIKNKKWKTYLQRKWSLGADVLRIKLKSIVMAKQKELMT